MRSNMMRKYRRNIFFRYSLSIRNKIMQLRFMDFAKEFIQFKMKNRYNTNRPFLIEFKDIYPCLNDKTSSTNFDKHYIYHQAWAARILSRINPSLHIDVSSSLYFCTIISAFIPIDFYDYRPPKLNLSNLKTGYADLLCLPFQDASIESLSCMHVIEHIGLGRYGDPLDPEGDLKAIKELKRVLAIQGNLLFVVPIGKIPRIEFNAHRIYSYCQIIDYFEDMELVEFSLITDNPELECYIYNASPELTEECEYGCGCFWFRKQDKYIEHNG